MIAVANNQERFGWEFLRQPIEQCTVVARRHFLTPNIFIDDGDVSKIAPVRSKLGAQARVPRKVISHGVNIKEKRPLTTLVGDDFGGLIEIKAVRFEIARAEIAHV